jgi:rRNA maturation endonuclease Nob1
MIERDTEFQITSEPAIAYSTCYRLPFIFCGLAINKLKMIKKIKEFNHELWKYCCGKWFDRRNDEYCSVCGKK